MTNSFHITAAINLLRAEGEVFLANIFATRPFNRVTVVSALRAKGLDMLADMVEARLEMHREFIAG